MADNVPIIVPVSSTSMATEEVVDNTGASTAQADGRRQIDSLPQGEYHLERVKITVGAYGKDAGDATFVNPLPVGTLQERRLLEEQMVSSMNQQRLAWATRSRERIDLVDRRGGYAMRGGR